MDLSDVAEILADIIPEGYAATQDSLRELAADPKFQALTPEQRSNLTAEMRRGGGIITAVFGAFTVAVMAVAS